MQAHLLLVILLQGLLSETTHAFPQGYQIGGIGRGYAGGDKNTNLIHFPGPNGWNRPVNEQYYPQKAQTDGAIGFQSSGGVIGQVPGSISYAPNPIYPQGSIDWNSQNNGQFYPQKAQTDGAIGFQSSGGVIGQVPGSASYVQEPFYPQSGQYNSNDGQQIGGIGSGYAG